MSMDKIVNVAGMIVMVAMATTLVRSPNTASIIRAVGESFAGSIRAAQAR